MQNTRYFISGTNHATGRRIAIMRNDIDEILCNGCLMCIYFKKRKPLILDIDGQQILIETHGLFALYHYYKDNFETTEHSYSLKFNTKEFYNG